jgi:Zn-dependent M28 family amino/carboxypeptidase
LFELVRSLDLDETNTRICLAFLDASDNEGLPGWQSVEGSRYLAENLDSDIDRCASPRAVLTLDMVGSAAEYAVEQRSTTEIVQILRQFAVDSEVDSLFVNQVGPIYNAEHIPFLERDIPAAHISDALYPFRHSTEDTLDKLDAAYFERIGRTLELWLEAGAP